MDGCFAWRLAYATTHSGNVKGHTMGQRAKACCMNVVTRSYQLSGRKFTCYYILALHKMILRKVILGIYDNSITDPYDNDYCKL